MTADVTKRWALTAGAVGLVGGLALGATGLASAGSPSPSPQARHHATPDSQHPRQPAPGARNHGLGGLVSAISDSSLTVRGPRGTHTVGLTGSTTFYEGPTKSTRSAVSVGDIVRVLLVDPNPKDPVASVVRVMPAAIAGWVMSTSGSTITVKDRGGFTRTITTTAATKVVKDGSESTLDAITVGSFVRAVGAVASDGTTLDARHIGIGAPPKRMRHHPRGQRPGGPAGEQPDA